MPRSVTLVKTKQCSRKHRTTLSLAAALLIAVATVGRGQAASSDVVIYASGASVSGNWSIASSGSAAQGQMLSSSDYGWSTTDAPLPSPGDFIEASFSAPADTPFHVWLRMRASSNSKYNDSVWVQFSDSNDQGGSSVYRIGSGGG